MAAGDFEEQVEALTGIAIDSSGTSPTQVELTQFLIDGINDVVNRMIEAKPAELPRFCNTTDSGAGTTVTKTGQILSVMREHDSTSILRPCARISPNDRYEATDVDSLRYRSKYNPAFYELDEVIHTIPAAAESGNNNVVVTQVAYDTALAFDDGKGDIDYFPTEYEYLVTLYAAIQSLMAAMSGKTSSLPSDITLSGLPAPPSLETITALTVSAVPPNIPTDPSFNTGAISISASAPSYNKGSGDDFGFAVPTLGTVNALVIRAAPVAPDVPSFTYTDASVASITRPISVLSDMATLTADAPTYTKPTLAQVIVPTISDLSISAVPPNVPTIATISYTDASTSPVNAPDKADISGDVPTFTKSVVAPDFAQVNTYIDTDQDVELASAKLQEISAQLNEYSTNIQNEQAEFNKENVRYQANIQAEINKTNHELQEAITNANNTIQVDLANRAKQMEDDIADNSSKLQKFQIEISEYQAEVNTEIQEYQQNFQKNLQLWQAERQTDLSRYSADMQNELNEFNKENVVYQEDVQRKLQNLQKDLQVAFKNIDTEVQANSTNLGKDVQIALQNAMQDYQQDVEEYNAKLAKYGAEVGSYQAEVNTAIQVWVNQEWNQNFQKYSTDYTNLLQTYQIDMQNELNEFNKEQAVYQNELQEKIQEANNQQTADSSEYAAGIQKYSAELQSYQSEVNTEVGEQAAALQRIQEINQSSLAKFNAELQRYTSDSQNEIANFTAKLQKQTTDYQWLQGRYVALLNQYNTAFNIPQPQQQQERRR